MTHQTWSTTAAQAKYMTNWPFHSNCVSLCHETECSTSGTIDPADLLPPESRQRNRHCLNWYQNIRSIDKGQGSLSLTYMARRPNVNSTHKTISFGLVRHFVNYICNYQWWSLETRRETRFLESRSRLEGLRSRLGLERFRSRSRALRLETCFFFNGIFYDVLQGIL